MKKNNYKLIMGIIIISLMIAISTVVFADNTPVIIGGGSANTQNTTQNTDTTPKNTETNNTVSNTSYKTNEEKLPQTGENDVYVIAILVSVCAISAIYAYKKIRDYNIK